MEVTLPEPDVLLANATAYLLQGQNLYEASILLLCSCIKVARYNADHYIKASVKIYLKGNRAVYEIIINREHAATKVIREAFNAALQPDCYVERLVPIVELPDYDPNWKTKLLEVIEGKIPLNQCVPIQDKPRFQWEYLYFRSPYEIAIAKALSEYHVLFLPNCKARFTREQQNKEADFLVCYDGKWGILEVDGETIHTDIAREYERDRLFESHGIRVIQHFTAKQCTNDPKGVVRRFLEILKKNG